MKPINIFTFVCLLSSSACSIHSTREPTNQYTFSEAIQIDNRKHRALDLLKQHYYHQSLLQWKILHAIEPMNPEFRNRIRVVEALAKRRARLELRKGREAETSKNYIEARRRYLKSLAINPSDKSAIAGLRRIEKNERMTKQLAKIEKLQQSQFANN